MGYRLALTAVGKSKMITEDEKKDLLNTKLNIKISAKEWWIKLSKCSDTKLSDYAKFMLAPVPNQEPPKI